MERYANKSGDSGVTAYEIGTDYIWVQFISGFKYLYTYRSTGATHVETMKALAEDGKGLCTFIAQRVKNNYAKKTRH